MFERAVSDELLRLLEISDCVIVPAKDELFWALLIYEQMEIREHVDAAIFDIAIHIKALSQDCKDVDCWKLAAEIFRIFLPIDLKSCSQEKGHQL